MIDLHLEHLINRVGDRYRRYELRRRLTVCWLMVATVAMVIWGLGTLLGGLPVWTVSVFLLVCVVAGVWTFLRFNSRSADRLWIARRIEEQHPELQSLLLTAVEQHPADSGALDYFQARVVQRALDHARQHDWREVLPDRKLAHAQRMQWAALLLLLPVTLLLWNTKPRSIRALAGLETDSAKMAGVEFDLQVEPGNVEIERGTALVVTARFGKRLPAEVRLATLPEAGEVTAVVMPKSLDDPVFAARIPMVDTALKYRVEYDQKQTEEFLVTVFDYPRLLQADAKIEFPSYAAKPAEVLEDIRQVTAVEGSRVTLTFRLNKPVAAAELVQADGPNMQLQAIDGAEGEYAVSFVMQQSGKYTLQLMDDAGRHNKYQPAIAINVLENRRPELKLTFPGRDQRVSPLEEMQVLASASDDFSLVAHGLVFAIGDTEPQTVTLGEQSNTVQTVSHLLRMEDLKAKPDQLLSYYVWADDHGPDGEVRRTESDMYFAEVRHFEEIFRQGESPGGGGGAAAGAQGGQANKIGDLIKLQKQIVTATWKLHRQSKIASDVTTMQEEVGIVTQSQQQVLEKLAEVQTKLRDSEAQQAAATAAKQMSQAIASLNEFANGDADESLLSAHAAERSAYQALLKLRAREHEVTKGQPQQGGGGGGGSSGRAQQQLQQLELAKKEDRYQNRRAASPQQDAAQRETNQVLNRLRELAQRQDDLNQQIKELQSALQAAEDEKEREELQRRLKRLREEQRELMQNADQLRDRMQQAPQQAETQETQQQVEQTRQNMRQASEALEKGQLSQALNAGTRAQRQLQQLRDEFRKKSAGAFSEEMQQMREDTRELAEKQQATAEQMEKLNDPERKSLRDVRQKEELGEQLAEQEQRLQDILQQMRDVSQAAETAEPLLSKQLYDTLRKTEQQQPGQLLKEAKRQLARGQSDRAEQAESRARESIEQLREGVEKAAESVLGNEIEALRKANQELAELTKQLNREIAQAQPKPAQNGAEQKGQQPGQNSQQAETKSPGTEGVNPGSQKGSPQGSQPGSEQASKQSSSPGSQKGSQQSPGSSAAPGQQGLASGGGRGGNRRQSLRDRAGRSEQRAAPGSPQQSSSEGGSSGGPGGPITGADFREWSDRLRDVEEMVEDPKLREQVAQVRDRARGMRAEFKRHSQEPNWSLVEKLVAQPLVELQDRLREEIARRESPESLVPIDRDPVPPQYREIVRRYYERLGSGK